MVLVSSCSCLYPIRWSQVLSWAPTGDASTTSEWSTIQLPTKVRLMLETWRYITTGASLWCQPLDVCSPFSHRHLKYGRKKTTRINHTWKHYCSCILLRWNYILWNPSSRSIYYWNVCAFTIWRLYILLSNITLIHAVRVNHISISNPRIIENNSSLCSVQIGPMSLVLHLFISALCITFLKRCIRENAKQAASKPFFINLFM